MKAEDYATAQSQILLLAGLIQDLPLEEFIAAIDRADVVCPIVDPTLWMQGERTMHKIRDIADAMRDVQVAVLKVGSRR